MSPHGNNDYIEQVKERFFTCRDDRLVLEAKAVMVDMEPKVRSRSKIINLFSWFILRFH